MPRFPRPSLPTTGCGLAFALVAALATGCSGINASKSISPLDFILPGLLQNSPPSPVIPNLTNTVPLLAQAGRFQPSLQP